MLFKKIFKNDNSITKEATLKQLKQIEENLFYGQMLCKIGSWTHNINTDEIFFTEQVYKILGRSPDEFDGKKENFYQFVHADDLGIVKGAIEGTYLGKEYDIEYRIIMPNGQVKYVREKTKVLYDETGAANRIVGTIKDITGQKIVERNLKEVGDNLNQAQRVAGVGSWKYDIEKDEFFGSEEMYRIYDIAPDDIKNGFDNVIKLVHPEDQFKIQDALEKHLSGQVCTVEFRIPQKNGQNKIVLGKGEPLFNNDGRVIGIIGTLQDITENKLLENKLKKANRIITQAQALAHIGSWEIDLTNYRCYWSDEVYRIFGVDPHEFDNTYKAFLEFIHPEDAARVLRIGDNPPKNPIELDFRIIRPDGSIRYIYELMEYVFDDEGEPIFLYGTTQDITEKMALQNRIEKIQKRFQVLIHESNDVFEILSSDGTIVYISEAVEKVIGFKPEERIGKKVYDYYEGKELQKITKMINSVLQEPGQKIEGELLIRTKTNKEVYLEVYMQNLLHEPSIEGIAINFRDITKRVKMQERIAFIASHDEKTGLPNRLYLKKELERLCNNAKDRGINFALIMLDIDGFKYFNDALGYELGDKLIVEIAKRLNDHLCNKGFLFKYSVDRFAIAIKGKDLSEYQSIARDIIQLFSQPFSVGKYDLNVIVNMGISVYHTNDTELEKIIKNAEIALFWARKEGKFKYKFYSSDISIQDYKQFELRNDLRSAVKGNQLLVYYQPLVNLNNNEILAAEALVRWKHPNWGMVSPIEFISLAEETGYIIDIGNWLFREVCRNYKQWQCLKQQPIKVSVNFSSIQFFESNFAENIIDTINEFELDPHFLIMEITESILIDKVDIAINNFQMLQSYGIQIALDDFGTGFSSLAYLNSFNIDILKLDGSFIKNVIKDDASTIITKNIIRMAQELKIKLVAEGIESWQQLNFLRQLKCHTGQGYIYSKPLPVEDFAKILVHKKISPVIATNTEIKMWEDRRKYFRIKFRDLLEMDLTIKEMKGKSVNVGNSKVLIEDIGAGGLRFITNLRLPAAKDIILQFSTQLNNKTIKVNGFIVWTNETDNDLFEYGVEFIIDENDRKDLIKLLNQVQIKMKNDILFAEGNFISTLPEVYFK